MRVIVPDYYPEFACIAGQCRHTCCRGWEIDVDEDTCALYASVPGAMGQRLAEAIVDDEDGAHFRLTEDERCPFLNADGLCDLILAYGEGALCQICDDHPRYRSFWPDRTEIGLGLCCEAAARLVLGWEAPVRLIDLEDDGDEPEPLTEDDEARLALRDRALLHLQDRSVPIDRRLATLPQLAGRT